VADDDAAAEPVGELVDDPVIVTEIVDDPVVVPVTDRKSVV
jgi:hypothetical protein